MGLLAQRWDTRNRADWLNDDDADSYGPRSAAGTRVNRTTALALPAVFRCWDLLSSAVAMAPRDVVVKLGGQSFPEFRAPAWVSLPNPNNPNYTGNDYFQGVALSILAAGEFFTYVVPDVTYPLGLTLMDPALIDVRGTISEPLYDIRDRSGRVVKTVGPSQMLHGTWMRMPGGLRGISPLEALRTAFGAALATQEHAARFFGQGTSLSFGVEVPGQLPKEKQDEMRANLRRKYAGLNNSHAIGVLTNGAKFVTGLAPTPEQAQFLASREFSVEDVCRIYGVPAAMAGSTQPGAASFASTDNYDKWFAQRAVQPLAERIEAQHDRLLALPSGLTSDNASIQFKFNLSSIERSTLLTRYQAFGEGVQKGFLTPNEVRALEDKPPVAGGDDLFMQQQMVGLSANSQRIADAGALVRAGFDPEAALAALGLPAIKHTGLVPVTVQGENVATAEAPGAPTP